MIRRVSSTSARCRSRMRSRSSAPRRSGKLVAGGHSLVPLMKLRMSEPGILIDIARVPGLSGIRGRTAT